MTNRHLTTDPRTDHEIREDAERDLPKRAVGPLSSNEQLTIPKDAEYTAAMKAWRDAHAGKTPGTTDCDLAWVGGYARALVDRRLAGETKPLTGVDFLQAWMRAQNPMLGNLVPLAMLKAGLGDRLAKFIEQAYEAERATPPRSER